jgi:hypothetical protein
VESNKKWSVVIQGETPLRAVHDEVRERGKVSPTEESVVQGANAAAVDKKGWRGGDVKFLGDVPESVRAGPILDRGQGAMRRIPSRVEVANDDAGAVRTLKMGENPSRDIVQEESRWRL